MTISFIRTFFLVMCAVTGYYVGSLLQVPMLGLGIGVGSAVLLILLERSMQRVSVRGLSSMVFGLLLGFFMAKLLSDILSLVPLTEFVRSVSRVILTLMFSYLGTVIALRGKDEFNIIIPYVKFRRQDVKDGVVLLDSSAIIDGRITDIYKTHFLVGRLVVPRFILHEIQALADSADDTKRERGRRGLELLRLMREDSKMDVHIHEDDLIGSEPVDSKLIRLARMMDARICTTDFNLGRTAELQGVDVLNVNELVHAVKSVLFTGDQIEVKLIKEGKESHQAIGYMDDGTMIVVSNARELIGQQVKVDVTSVLQTQAGKMIFAKI